MITSVLETTSDQLIEKCSKKGNERYLIQKNPNYMLLSQLSEFDNDVFGKADMPILIEELTAIRRTLGPEDQAHIDDILRLSVRCRDEEGLTLAFTPFL